MSVRATPLSVLFAAYLLALPDANVGSALAPVVLASYVLAPVIIGTLSGWRALPTFGAAFLVTSIAYQLLVWQDDPRLAGIDDIPPVAGILLVVPFMLVPMGIGAAIRGRWLTRRARGTPEHRRR